MNIVKSVLDMAKEITKPVPTIKEWAQTYQERKFAKTSLRESTKRATEYQVRCNLIPAFGHLPLNKFTAHHWNVWVLSAQRDNVKKITRFFNARKCMIELLHAAKEEGLIERVPKLDNPDEPKNVGRILSDREVWLLLRHTTYRIFRLAFYTMYKMGCRPREILKWEWAMIKWGTENNYTWLDIPARITKTGRNRRIPLNPIVAKHLRRIYDKGNVGKYVFQDRLGRNKPQLSYHGAFATARRKAKIPHCVVYDFRRTLITKAMAANKPGVYLAKILDTSMKQIEGTYSKEQQDVMENIVS